MNDRTAHNPALEALLRERIVILDGAMGTMFQAQKLAEVDYRGKLFADHSADLRNNNEVLSLTQPELVEQIHRQYLAAGADIIETNTFSATPIAQADYDLSAICHDLNVESAKLAKKVAADYMTAYEKLYGNRPATFGANVYDAGLLLQRAIPEALRKGNSNGGRDALLRAAIVRTPQPLDNFLI